MSGMCEAGFEIPDYGPCEECGATDDERCRLVDDGSRLRAKQTRIKFDIDSVFDEMRTLCEDKASLEEEVDQLEAEVDTLNARIFELEEQINE